MDYRQHCINLIASLGTNAHNDCADDMFDAIKLMGIEVPDWLDDQYALTVWLGKHHGATTMGGNYPYYTPEEDDCRLCGRMRVECQGDWDSEIECPGDEGDE